MFFCVNDTVNKELSSLFTAVYNVEQQRMAPSLKEKAFVYNVSRVQSTNLPLHHVTFFALLNEMWSERKTFSHIKKLAILRAWKNIYTEKVKHFPAIIIIIV